MTTKIFAPGTILKTGELLKTINFNKNEAKNALKERNAKLFDKAVLEIVTAAANIQVLRK
jgi:hypothetical protein